MLFAGISKGGFGSGAAFAAASILALVIEPGLALGVMLPLLMLIDASALRPYWRKWSGIDVKLLLIGGLPGIAVGAALYQVASPDLFRLLIGGVAVGFVVWHLALASGLIRLARTRMPDLAGVLIGSVVGFTTFVSHAGGPPAAVFLLSRGLTKTQYQATTVLLFWVLNIVKFLPYAAGPRPICNPRHLDRRPGAPSGARTPLFCADLCAFVCHRDQADLGRADLTG